MALVAALPAAISKFLFSILARTHPRATVPPMARSLLNRRTKFIPIESTPAADMKSSECYESGTRRVVVTSRAASSLFPAVAPLRYIVRIETGSGDFG